ncbi:MAG: hypothetical protein JW809_09715 [Pirellulales bacterium]|nr:hypothetical protein [Pirellulales bacterium]
MPIEFRCTQCDKLLRTPDETAGRQAKCPVCGTVVTVPEPAPPASPFGSQPGGSGSPLGSGGGTPFGPSDPANPYQAPAYYAEGTEAFGPVAAGAVTPTLIDIGEIFSRTWAAFKDNWGMTLLVLFVGGVINFGVSWGVSLVVAIIGAVLGNPILAMGAHVLGNVASQVFAWWIAVGQAMVFLKLLRGQPTSLGEMFNGGPYLLRTIGAWILFFLGAIAILAVGVLPGVFVGLATGWNELSVFTMIGGGLVAGVFLVIYGLTFSQFFYFIIDRNAGIMESFEGSRQVTAGNRLTMFAIQLIAGLAGFVLIIITCLLGALAVGPYMALLVPVMYLSMTGQPMARRYMA